MFIQYSILIIYAFCLLAIFIFSIGQAFLIYYYIKSSKKEVKALSWHHQPKVTVQLPLFNELYVVKRLIKSVCELDYPKELLEIQVLDDSTDDSLALTAQLVKEQQADGFNIKHITRTKNIGFKAGALQHGLEQASGELIAIFDADFVPSQDFLQKLVPYFQDAKLGMVQSKWEHLNEDYSLLTKIQSFGLDGHFTVEQTGRNKQNLFINFNGTAGIWRKACIVEAGGWQHDTLTEDLDLSYRAQLKGWKFKYVEDFSTPAELPMELNAYKSQQHRWTKGAIETSKKMLSQIWKSDESLARKIFGSLHLLNSYAFLLVFTASILSLPILVIKNLHLVDILYFNLMTIFVGGFIIVTIFYTTSYFSKKTSLLNFVKLFPVFLSFSMAMSFHNAIAVLEGIFGFKSDFIRTPKFNINNKKEGFKDNIYIKKSLPKSFYVELFLTFYFLSGMMMSFIYQDFGLLPFHTLLFCGFCMLNFYSIKHSLGGLKIKA
ncbi:cellulose synthase family protein [Pedobacter glucosidilyticus]|uniref:cellulose synthase family protein n=1 Tax=Pedobacter glucosidilyticus TaxID=1122941 RepID=UPI0026F25A87|nr:glycosyltransferase family 2 protein [Pedobacter glucosidilyticus]